MIQVLRKALGKGDLGLWGVFLARLYSTAPRMTAPAGKDGRATWRAGPGAESRAGGAVWPPRTL